MTISDVFISLGFLLGIPLAAVLMVKYIVWLAGKVGLL